MRAASRRPKVLILLDTHVVSGPAKGLFQFLEYADRSRFDFILGVFQYANPRSLDFLEAVRARNLPYRLIPHRRRFDLSPLSEAVKIGKEEGCTVIQSHGYKSHLIGAWVKFRTGIRWIAVSHGWTAENFKVKLYHLLDHLLLPYSDAAVAVAPDMRKTVAGIVKDESRVHLILNAIDSAPVTEPSSRERIRNELGIPPGALVFGCFGRFSREKGQSVLLEAFVAAKLHDAHLVLVGDGVDREMLASRAAASDLAGRVHFAGYQRNIAPYYAAIDLLVIPSLSEGMPNVLLEGMSLGIPVISTDVGGVREALIPQESGWLVPPGDRDALASALAAAEREPQQRIRYGDRGKELLFPKFEPRSRAERFVALYERLSS